MIATRYMTDDHRARIVAHVFETTAAELLPTTLGHASIAIRETPGDVWGPPKMVSPDLNYNTWRALCEGHGFIFEDVTA